MKILKYILYIILGIAALIAALGLFAKKSYHIERSIVIDAPKSLVFEQVQMFKNFHEWSPWSKLDPDMKLTYTGTDGEIGAAYSWDGNSDAGAGTQTLKMVSPDRLEFDLDLLRPFEASIPVFFELTGDEEKTKVTWGLEPNFPFPINVWSMFTDIDKAMGSDYARGLGFLKRRCEGMAHKKYHGYEVAEEDLPEAIYIGIRAMVDTVDIDSFFAENLPKIMEIIDSVALEIEGPPTGLYWEFDAESGQWDMAAAVPVKAAKKAPKGFQLFNKSKGKALVIDYLGPYTGIAEAHLGMDDYMAGNKLRNILPVVEWYLTDPGSEPDTAMWLTKVIYYVEPNPDSTVQKQ